MTITKNQRVTLMNKPFQQYHHHQEHEQQQQQQYIPQQHHHHEATNFNQTITCTKPNRNMKKFIVNNHHQAQQHIPTQQQQQQYNECNKTQFNPNVTDNYNKKKSAITTSQDQGFISSKTSSNMNNLNPISSSSSSHHLLNPTTLTTCNNPTNTTTTTHHTNNNNQGFCLILDTQATNIHSNQSLQMHFRCKKSYKDYTVEDISQYFHLPIKEVANNLSVSVTFLKKVCRRLNISRWPYRKVSSLNKKTSSSTSLDSNNNNNISIPTNNNNNINININIDSKIITEDHSSSSFSTQSNESSSLTSSSNNNNNMLMMNNNTTQQRLVTTSPMSMYTNAHPYSNYDNNNSICKDSGILENHSNNIIHKEINIHDTNNTNASKDFKNPSSESSPSTNTTYYSSSTVNAFNHHCNNTTSTTPQYNVSFKHHTMRDSSKYCTFDSYCSPTTTRTTCTPPPFNTNSMFESTCSNKKMMEYNSIPIDEKRRGSIDSIIDRRGSVDQNEIICPSSSSNYQSSNSSFEKASVNNSNESKIFRDFTSKEVIYLPSFNDFCKQAGL